MKYAAAALMIVAGLSFAAPARAGDGILPDCDGCPPPPSAYDNQPALRPLPEVREPVAPPSAYVPAPRKIVYGGIAARPSVTVVNFVVHKYRVIYAGEMGEGLEGAA